MGLTYDTKQKTWLHGTSGKVFSGIPDPERAARQGFHGGGVVYGSRSRSTAEGYGGFIDETLVDYAADRGVDLSRDMEPFRVKEMVMDPNSLILTSQNTGSRQSYPEFTKDKVRIPNRVNLKQGVSNTYTALNNEILRLGLDPARSGQVKRLKELQHRLVDLIDSQKVPSKASQSDLVQLLLDIDSKQQGERAGSKVPTMGKMMDDFHLDGIIHEGVGPEGKPSSTLTYSVRGKNKVKLLPNFEKKYAAQFRVLDAFELADKGELGKAQQLMTELTSELNLSLDEVTALVKDVDTSRRYNNINTQWEKFKVENNTRKIRTNLIEEYMDEIYAQGGTPDWDDLMTEDSDLSWRITEEMGPANTRGVFTLEDIMSEEEIDELRELDNDASRRKVAKAIKRERVGDLNSIEKFENRLKVALDTPNKNAGSLQDAGVKATKLPTAEEAMKSKIRLRDRSERITSFLKRFGNNSGQLLAAIMMPMPLKGAATGGKLAWGAAESAFAVDDIAWLADLTGAFDSEMGRQTKEAQAANAKGEQYTANMSRLAPFLGGESKPGISAPTSGDEMEQASALRGEWQKTPAGQQAYTNAVMGAVGNTRPGDNWLSSLLGIE